MAGWFTRQQQKQLQHSFPFGPLARLCNGLKNLQEGQWLSPLLIWLSVAVGSREGSGGAQEVPDRANQIAQNFGVALSLVLLPV